MVYVIYSFILLTAEAVTTSILRMMNVSWKMFSNCLMMSKILI